MITILARWRSIAPSSESISNVARIIDDAYQRHHQDAFQYRHHRAGEFAHGRTEQLTLTH